MSKTHSWILLFLLTLAGSAARGTETELCLGENFLHFWHFNAGTEFPGARITPSDADGKLRVAYDFTGGGNYVAVQWNGLAPYSERVFWEFSVDQQTELSLRVFDGNNRCFFVPLGRFSPGRHRVERTVAEIGSSDSWGGVPEEKTLLQPIRTIALGIQRNPELPVTGTVNDLRTGIIKSSNNTVRFPFSGEKTEVNWNGWKIVATWNLTDFAVPVLELNVRDLNAARDLEIEATMPLNGRPQRESHTFAPGSSRDVLFALVPGSGQNPAMRYRVTLHLRAGDQEMRLPVFLTGNAWSPLKLGQCPLPVDAGTDSMFGTVVHLNRTSTMWKNYRHIIDKIAECDIQWVREDLHGDSFDADGKFIPWEENLRWMRYAKSKGLKILGVIQMHGDEPLESFAARCRGSAIGWKGIIDAFELGNEPQNFNNWRGDQPWNAREPDNSTSEWALKFLAYTNRAIQEMKEADPECRIIGIGADSCVNRRLIETGVDPRIDGFVDHPYSFVFPPEKVPWNSGLAERDGVTVGDAESSFFGLIDTYREITAANDRIRPLWITENGYTTFWQDAENTKKGMYLNYSEAAQSAYLVRRILLCAREPLIAKLFIYDFMDDIESLPGEPEANFGLMRGAGDYSLKPSYYAVQRVIALLNGARGDDRIRIEVDAPLRNGARKYTLSRWDQSSVEANNEVLAFAYRTADGEEMIGVWNAQPFSGELNNRFATLSVTGLSGEVNRAVAIDTLTGDCFDVPVKIREKGTVSFGLSIGQSPLIVKFFP